MREDEIFALIGPNGVCETTALRVVGAIIQPASGAIKSPGLNAISKAVKAREIISCFPYSAIFSYHSCWKADISKRLNVVVYQSD